MQVMLFLVVITLHFGESSQTSCGKGTQPHMQSRIYEWWIKYPLFLTVKPTAQIATQQSLAWLFAKSELLKTSVTKQ